MLARTLPVGFRVFIVLIFHDATRFAFGVPPIHLTPRCNPVDFLEDNLYDAHVGKSAYALQLARWFAVFGRDKFKVHTCDHVYRSKRVGPGRRQAVFYGDLCL